MGRPPGNGVPAFRFTKAEVTMMETMIQENNYTTPDLEVLETLAKKFSESADRKGKVVVQVKQVWHWFQNKKYAVRAKLKECIPKISRPAFRFFADEITEMKKVLQEHNYAMPPFELLIDLAKKFSEAPHRKGHTVIQGKQVCNWFHNRRHDICAKLYKSGAKIDVPSISLDVPTLMRSMPQVGAAPLPAPMPVPIPVPAIECAPSLGLSCTSSAPAIASTSSESLLPMPVLELVPMHASTDLPASASGPTPALDSGSVLAVRRALRKICMEFEAKSSRDGAWHIVASFLSYKYPVMDDMEALVHFADCKEGDEWVNVCKHVRVRSLAHKSKYAALQS